MQGDDSSDEAENATPETDISQKLQMALLDYLIYNGQKDPALLVSLPIGSEPRGSVAAMAS